MNDSLSFRDFTGWDLRDHPDLIKLLIPGTVIDRSCFSHEVPDSEFIPSDIKGIIFSNCNMDNCLIPPGNIVIGGTQRRFMAQNDLRDWEISEMDLPISLVTEKYFTDNGYSIDPSEIPPDKVDSVYEMTLTNIAADKAANPTSWLQKLSNWMFGSSTKGKP